jgi:hypothetical protein
LAPDDIPTATTMKPTMSGARFARTGGLTSSVSAKTNATRNAVPTTWSMKGPSHVPKYLAGNVAKIEYVGTELRSPRVMWLARSKLPTAAL